VYSREEKDYKLVEPRSSNQGGDALFSRGKKRKEECDVTCTRGKGGEPKVMNYKNTDYLCSNLGGPCIREDIFTKKVNIL